MSIKDNKEDDSTVVECDRCGYECDPRGLSNHKGSARCDYLKDERFRYEEGFTHDLSDANRQIRDWIDKNTEDGVKRLCSRFSLGGPNWNPATGYKHYTTPAAWQKFLRQNRLTNPEKQADQKVQIHNITDKKVTVWVEIHDGEDLDPRDFENEAGIDNKLKAWIRQSDNGDVVLYTVDGDRIGSKY